MPGETQRKADYAINKMFLERWSPRAFTAEPISHDDLFTMLEAARWAASSSNLQPWRFLYAHRDTPHWPTLLGLLNETNQSWAKNASALVVIISRATMPKKGAAQEVPSPTHSYDAGTSSGYFTLQASLMGWHAHGMAGFDKERTRTALSIPEEFSIEAVYAVGRIADPSTLPDALREREFPSSRKPLTELAFEGGFPKS